MACRETPAASAMSPSVTLATPRFSIRRQAVFNSVVRVSGAWCAVSFAIIFPLYTCQVNVLYMCKVAPAAGNGKSCNRPGSEEGHGDRRPRGAYRADRRPSADVERRHTSTYGLGRDHRQHARVVRLPRL